MFEYIQQYICGNRSKCGDHFRVLFSTFMVFGMPVFVFAAAMSSSNYSIDFDSINVGGLDTGTSANFIMKDTVGEVATGQSNSANYTMRAGYRQMENQQISITVSDNVSGSVALGHLGLLQNSAVASTTFTVVSQNAGYTLSIEALASPALQDSTTGNQFTDYTENSDGVPETWNVDNNTYQFGFSVFGADADTKYGTTASCDIADNSNKWEGLSTTQNQIASRASQTPAGGTDTTVCFATEQVGVFAPSGTYSATVRVTALPQ